MPSSVTRFDGLTEVIYTEAIVINAADDLENPRNSLVNMAVWDTGAQMTIISPRLVKELGLKPIGKGLVVGIGGDGCGDVYKIHLGFPSRQVIFDVQVISYDLDDYDILIGMDVISKMDFLITNKDNTVFSFRYPSEGNVELK